MSDFEKQVTALVDKAAKAGDHDMAMRFSQAALNVAHAGQVLATMKKEGAEPPAPEDGLMPKADPLDAFPSLADLTTRTDEDIVRIWLAERGLVAVERELAQVCASSGVLGAYDANLDRYVRSRLRPVTAA